MVLSFLHPGVRAIVDFVLFGVAHDHDFATEGFLTFLDEMGKTVAHPIHLVILRLGLGLDVVRVVANVDIVEL